MGQACQRRAEKSEVPAEAKRQGAASATAARKSATAAKPTTASQPRATPTVLPSNQKFDGKSAEDWKTEGNEAVKKEDYAAACDIYSKGLKADPNHAMLLSNRALCLEKLGRIEEAVADAKRCTVLRPDFVKAYVRAATLLGGLNRPQEAVDLLKQAPASSDIEALLVKLKPGAQKAEKSRLASLSPAEKLKEEGNALYKKGFFEKALEAYKKALKACKDPKGELAIAIHNNCAGCYQQLSDFHAVVKETTFVLEHEPDNLKALLRRMIALEPLEKYEEALEDARHVIKHAPANEVANKLQHRLSKLVRDRHRGGS